ncbi:hypothetical protein PINS_up009464 [Pythium insidiosum]|nr:hypothetical protein PINS_up009464 [Pythium insidiosum]
MSPRSFTCLWSLIVVLHAVCAVFPALVGTLYVYIPVHTPRIAKNAELYSVSVNREYFSTIAVFYFIASGIHLACLVFILQLSFRHSRLLLASPRGRSPTLRQSRAVKPSPNVNAVRVSRPDLNSGRIHRVRRTVFDWLTVMWSALDVTDTSYDAVHLTREIIQTALLTYQTYKASYLVAVPWMNNTLVLLLVLNCWSTPLVHSTVRSHLFRARLFSIAMNVALDMMMYIVIPVALFIPYYERVDAIAGSYASNDFWYTDRWLMRVLTEWRMLFVTSLADGISKIIVTLSITIALLEMPRLVVPQRTPSSPTGIVPFSSNSHMSSTAKPSGPSRQLSNSSLESNSFGKKKVIRAVLVVMFFWGLLVASLHLHAASYSPNRQCVSQVRPWFARRAACSLLEINCQRNAETSGAVEFARILGEIDAPWLSYLVIRHCSYVEITPEFRRLTSLQGFKIFNSTLVRWHEDAALTHQDHPGALFVFLADVNVTEFPRGLHAAAFPQKLMDIEICQSNMSTLPPQVAQSWPKGMYLLLEGIQFSAFPQVLTQLEPQSLSLVRSSISTVPAALFESSRLEWLKLSGTGLTQLPSSVRKVPPLRFFFFQSTAIATLPQWMNLDVIFEAQAGDTPLCAALANGTASSKEEEARMERLRRIVKCTMPKSRDALFHFPITREMINNP